MRQSLHTKDFSHRSLRLLLNGRYTHDKGQFTCISDIYATELKKVKVIGSIPTNQRLFNSVAKNYIKSKIYVLYKCQDHQLCQKINIGLT